jgi:hypothetical protein
MDRLDALQLLVTDARTTRLDAAPLGDRGDRSRRRIYHTEEGRAQARARYLSPHLKQKRLSFAQGYAAWTADDWERVIFTDEKCFDGEGCCGQVWCRSRRPNWQGRSTQRDVHRAQNTASGELQGERVWGSFCAKGEGYILVIFNDSESVNLVATAKLHYDVDTAERWFLLQHDNDKKFRSNLVTEWLHNAGVTVIEFPPYPPHLNPIENDSTRATRDRLTLRTVLKICGLNAGNSCDLYVNFDVNERTATQSLALRRPCLIVLFRIVPPPVL